MPLYEYYCLTCDYTFEVLSPLSEASKKKPCPECGKRAPRVVSAFAIASSGSDRHEGDAAVIAQQPRDPRPLCMKYPQIPLSCHMDEPSVRRFAAHAAGRGNEYDDKIAKAAEVRKQRGIPDPVYAPPAHGHDHSHERNPRRHAVTQHQEHSHNHANGHARSHGHSHTKGKSHTHTHGTHTH